MSVRIIQSNSRVAEVQVIYKSCGKFIQTSVIPKQEVEANRDKVICCQCKASEPKI